MDCARDVAHVAGAVGAQRRPSVVDLHTLEEHVLRAVADAPLECVRVVRVACANKVSETDPPSGMSGKQDDSRTVPLFKQRKTTGACSSP